MVVDEMDTERWYANALSDVTFFYVSPGMNDGYFRSLTPPHSSEPDGVHSQLNPLLP